MKKSRFPASLGEKKKKENLATVLQIQEELEGRRGAPF